MGLACAGFALALPTLARSAAALERPTFDQPAFAARVERALKQAGLAPDQASLVIRSSRERSELYALRAHEPMIPASNAKLITSYAALRRLSPQFRWKTRFLLVEQHDDPALPARQGLLVEAGGDPTLRRGDLEVIAGRLRALGVQELNGPLYYDAALFQDSPYPKAWGAVEGDMPWYAPVSPFILNLNTVGFVVTVRAGGPEESRAQVLPEDPWPGMRIVTHFSWIPEGRESIRVRQLHSMPELTFAVSGELLPVERTYTVATAITDPIDHFFRQFRLALHEAGIAGELPQTPMEGDRPRARELYIHSSPPLADVLGEVNKESNNLVAEVLLRALAFERKRRGLTGEDGLEIVNAVLAEDFPAYRDQVRLVDGSGLSRDNRVTAAFLVALLERVLSRFEFSAEYLRSLSVGGLDGTLLDRAIPRRYWGRLRAKTGTLKDVQNLTGYFQFGNDLLILSFLIRDDSRDFMALQRAQDRALTGILDAYLAGIAPPPSVKPPRPARKGTLAPPPTAEKNPSASALTR
jgi:D-alanyl-D-alanine carboxypeptidase/D-alanyl-D-alanine-endopeptidase (penicillin-binding protein 4)